jgi:phage gpG-like protein
MAAQQTFNLQSKDAENLLAKFARVRVSSIKPMLDDIARTYRQFRKGTFKQKGGGKWADLADSTKKYKTRILGSPYPILVLSGNLEASYTKKSNPQNISIIRKNSLTVGSSVDYARRHEEGEPKKNLPARPVAPFINEEPAYREIMQNFYIDIFRLAGIKVN